MISAIDDVEDKDEFDMELLETASDVSKALCIAVEILSDLMTISKIESNMMVLHRSPVAVQKFIDDGVAAFAAEAREKKVNIVVHPLFDDSSPRSPRSMRRSSLSLLTGKAGVAVGDQPPKFPGVKGIVDSDLMHVDKFKVSDGPPTRRSYPFLVVHMARSSMCFLLRSWTKCCETSFQTR